MTKSVTELMTLANGLEAARERNASGSNLRRLPSSGLSEMVYTMVTSSKMGRLRDSLGAWGLKGE